MPPPITFRDRFAGGPFQCLAPSPGRTDRRTDLHRLGERASGRGEAIVLTNRPTDQPRSPDASAALHYNYMLHSTSTAAARRSVSLAQARVATNSSLHRHFSVRVVSERF